MNRFFIALSLVLISTLLSCKKELSYIGDPDNPINVVLPDPITATLQGNIVDENNLPAAGVTITVGTQTAITDNAGFFRIIAAALDKNTALVTAQKTGYFKALRTFNATSGTNQVNIKLVKKTMAGTVSSTAGGEVTLINGSKIALPANGIVVASSNASYSGSINVYAAYIDPTADDINQTIPGSFMAENKSGSRVTLDSYGMLAVELEGASGEKLQIKTGNTATLTTAIPTSVQSRAPANIALWSIDEQTGLWKEEGSAKKNGNLYVGEVSHFSFWNCDVGIPTIKLTVTLLDKNGAPIVHATVKLTSTSNGMSYGVTDSLGVVCGLVPKNQTLTLEILSACKTTIYTQTIGPFSQNTSLNPITVSGADFTSSYFTVQGVLVNCTSGPVTNGYALITYGTNSRWIRVDGSGNFTSSFIHCPGSTITNVQILGVDDVAQQQGSVVTTAISLPVTNAGTISTCGASSTQFINFTLDGTAYAITSGITSDSTGGTTRQTSGTTGYSTTLSGFENGKTFIMLFNHSTATEGTYPVNSYIVINVGGTNYAVQGNSGISVTFTKFAQSLGEFYEGTFSGTFTQGGTTHTITAGSFKLRRNN